MEKVNVRDQNADFGKPVDWDTAQDGKCGSLPVRRQQIGRRQYHFSNWLPSAEELAHLNRGGVVELCCVGIQPPVSVGVVDRAPKAEATPERDLEAMKRAAEGK